MFLDDCKPDTEIQETEQEGSDEEYDGGMHVSLGSLKIWDRLILHPLET